MTLRQLRYVLAVAETGSFTRAAERMHVSQPTLSQQVAALEAELGGALFFRPPHQVALTAAGRALHEHARMAVTAAERAATAARRASGLQEWALDVCTVASVAAGIIPDVVCRWREGCTDGIIRLHEYADRERVAQALNEGRGEIGIAPRPPAWPGATEPLGWDRFVILLPDADPLADAGGPIALRALAGRDWILFDPDSRLAETDLRLGDADSAPLIPAVRVEHAEAAARLAAAGVGPAVLPLMTVPEALLPAVRPLDPPMATEIVAIAPGPEWPSEARAFVQLLRTSSCWRRGARLADELVTTAS